LIFAQSDSPSRKYRCEVIRVRSQLSKILEDGKFLYYDFNLRDIDTGQSLPGESFHYGNGSVQLDANKLEFKWTENQLSVIDHAQSPARQFLVASIDSTGQHWKQTN
jgi:hypothetical protein